VVRRVEQARLRGRKSTPTLYFQSIMIHLRLGDDRSVPPLTIERPGEPPETDLSTVIVQNTAPWTYLGDRAIHPSPSASFDRGLNAVALRRLALPATARTFARLATRKGEPTGKQVLHLHDQTEFTVVASRPQPFQLDGDYLGERQKVHFVSVPDALRVIC
jgi:diacylglycerol kinase family enzyme